MKVMGHRARIPGLKTAKASLRWLRSRLGRHALILGYHRVDDPSDGDPFSLCVSPRHFAEQLEILRNLANPIPLAELVECLRHGAPPRRAVIITLDDGYADNLYQAKPILEKYGVPASVFVTTGLLGCEAWWDELARIVSSATSLPEQIEVDLDGFALGWDQRAASPTAHPQSNSGRGALVRSLYQTLRGWPSERRARGLAGLSEILGVATPAEPHHRGLRADELRQLAAGGSIEIGAHSVSHPHLSALPYDEQQAEIRGGKELLDGMLDRPVRSFSYPNGSASDETAACVREAGFECACGSFGDVARSGSDPFRLPRFWVPDQHGASFERWLRRWLSG